METAQRIFVMGDIHGQYAKLTDLLRGADLMDEALASPGTCEELAFSACRFDFLPGIWQHSERGQCGSGCSFTAQARRGMGSFAACLLTSPGISRFANRWIGACDTYLADVWW